MRTIGEAKEDEIRCRETPGGYVIERRGRWVVVQYAVVQDRRIAEIVLDAIKKSEGGND